MKTAVFIVVALAVLCATTEARMPTVENTFAKSDSMLRRMKPMAISDQTYKDLVHMYFKTYRDSSCTQRTSKVTAIPVNTCLTLDTNYVKITPTDTSSAKFVFYSNSDCSTMSSSSATIDSSSCYTATMASTKTMYLKADSLMVISGEVPRGLIIPDIFGLTGSQAAFAQHVSASDCTTVTTAGSQDYQHITSYGTDTGDCYATGTGTGYFTATNNKDKVTIQMYSDSSCTNAGSSLDFTHETCYAASSYTAWSSQYASAVSFAHLNGWALVAIICFVIFLICCFLGLIPVLGCIFIGIAIWMLVWAIEGKNNWDDKGSDSIG